MQFQFAFHRMAMSSVRELNVQLLVQPTDDSFDAEEGYFDAWLKDLKVMVEFFKKCPSESGLEKYELDEAQQLCQNNHVSFSEMLEKFFTFPFLAGSS